MYLDPAKCPPLNPSLLQVTYEAKEDEEEEGGVQMEVKGSAGIYGDKLLGSGRVCGSGIDQPSMRRTRGPNPDP